MANSLIHPRRDARLRQVVALNNRITRALHWLCNLVYSLKVGWVSPLLAGLSPRQSLRAVISQLRGLQRTSVALTWGVAINMLCR
jgi:hypothetical protein